METSVVLNAVYICWLKSIFDLGRIYMKTFKLKNKIIYEHLLEYLWQKMLSSATYL